MNSGKESGKNDLHDYFSKALLNPCVSDAASCRNDLSELLAMAAKGFFVPMARSGRIPKKVKVKEEDKGEEGGSLLQVLGSREVDLVQKILNFLDPVCAKYDHS